MSHELIPLDEPQPRRELTNFQGEGWDRLAFLSKCTQEECVDMAESEGTEIPMVYYYVHAIDLPDDKTGEPKPAVRVVLVGKNDLAYEFVSDGILASLRMIVTAMGPGPYDPPMNVIPRSAKTRKGFTRYFLEPAQLQQPQAAK